MKLADGTGTPFHLVHWASGNIAFVRDSGGFLIGEPAFAAAVRRGFAEMRPAGGEQATGQASRIFQASVTVFT